MPASLDEPRLASVIGQPSPSQPAAVASERQARRRGKTPRRIERSSGVRAWRWRRYVISSPAFQWCASGPQHGGQAFPGDHRSWYYHAGTAAFGVGLSRRRRTRLKPSRRMGSKSEMPLRETTGEGRHLVKRRTDSQNCGKAAPRNGVHGVLIHQPRANPRWCSAAYDIQSATT